jgi:hypothetical protein
MWNFSRLNDKLGFWQNIRFSCLILIRSRLTPNANLDPFVAMAGVLVLEILASLLGQHYRAFESFSTD